MKETSVKSLRILVDIYGEDRETNTDTVIELDLYKKTDLFRDFVVNWSDSLYFSNSIYI